MKCKCGGELSMYGTGHRDTINIRCLKCEKKHNTFYFKEQAEKREKVIDDIDDEFFCKYCDNTKSINGLLCPYCSSLTEEKLIERQTKKLAQIKEIIDTYKGGM